MNIDSDICIYKHVYIFIIVIYYYIYIIIQQINDMGGLYVPLYLCITHIDMYRIRV
jgi:hypothetical protein